MNEYLDKLKDIARHSTYHENRFNAVKKIIADWKDDPDIPTLLKKIAENDFYCGEDLYYSRDVSPYREKAIRELVRGWKDDSDTLPWLEKIVSSKFSARLYSYSDEEDRYYNDPIRLTAAREIAENWKHD